MAIRRVTADLTSGDKAPQFGEGLNRGLTQKVGARANPRTHEQSAPAFGAH